mgnify:CR=1 FL=1
MTTTINEALETFVPPCSFEYRDLLSRWAESRRIDGDELWDVLAAIDHGLIPPTTTYDLDKIATQLGILKEALQVKEIYTMLMDIEGLGWLLKYDEHHEVEAALRTLVALCADIFATASSTAVDLQNRAYSLRVANDRDRERCAFRIKCHASDVIDDVFSRMEPALNSVISIMVQISGYEPDLCGYCGDGYCQYCSDTAPDDAINAFAEQCYQWWSERNPADVPRLEWLESSYTVVRLISGNAVTYGNREHYASTWKHYSVDPALQRRLASDGSRVMWREKVES